MTYIVNKLLNFFVPSTIPPRYDRSPITGVRRLSKLWGPISGEQMADMVIGNVEETKERTRRERESSVANRNGFSAYDESTLAGRYTECPGDPFQSEPSYYDEPSAKACCAILDAMPEMISGKDMAEAVFNGTKDLDDQAACSEFLVFEKWAESNPDKITPGAQQILDIYRKYADAANLDGGRTGFTASEFSQMFQEMSHACGGFDTNGYPESNEIASFQNWANSNRQEFSLAARKVLNIFQEYTDGSRLDGSSLTAFDYMNMIQEMLNVYRKDASSEYAIKGLSNKHSQISGEEMANAIEQGTQGLDSYAVSREFEAFDNWAILNGFRLSPEAKKVMDIYRKYASLSPGSETGISVSDFPGMRQEMYDAAYTDVSAEEVIRKLNRRSGPISGIDLARAIEQGTRDSDNQAVGREFEAFRNWANTYPHKLSLEAYRVMDVYQKYVDKSLSQGLQGEAGLAEPEYRSMIEEMRTAGKTDAERIMDLIKEMLAERKHGRTVVSPGLARTDGWIQL